MKTSKTTDFKFKIYIGMSAGTGKTYRMLQDAHELLRSGIDLEVGYVETHQRPETEALLAGLPLIPRRKLFYKGKAFEEMDLAAILQRSPQLVIVDELAHSNAEGSKNPKRWQDVCDLLHAGIGVLSAVNIQHLESLNSEIEQLTGISITERVPDTVFQLADEVVNIDLTVAELIERMEAGKIYEPMKSKQALRNFFQPATLLQLRELALREAARHLEHKIRADLPPSARLAPEKFMACISANPTHAGRIIRKTARLASYYHAPWILLYVQRSQEGPTQIRPDLQRHLINHLKLGASLGAEVIRIKHQDVAGTIIRLAQDKQVRTLCIGRPRINIFQILRKTAIFNQLLNHLAQSDIDLIILS